jgi:glycogen synthase
MGGVDLLILAASHVAAQIWQHVLLPQIRERWGDKAIAAKNAADKAAARKAAAATKPPAPPKSAARKPTR